MPMAPRVLLFCLLVLAVIEGRCREAAIPGCHLHPFNVTVRSDRHGTCQGSHVAQACVGHCESSAFPSRYSVLVASGYRHNVTSLSQCCTISRLKKVRDLGLMGTRGGKEWEQIWVPPTGEGVAGLRGEPAGGA
ncbi:glycoprotein hormone alpha-2 isoform X1 [Microtus pennsylvanicus]|uniref:glycoprotein hormone alpha-2 isoform X1 n=1 Tax=Microtus pennsylvanicus TaxID=10058 RepID=UPI003F6D7583